jgi:hypothetical protein
LSQATDATLVQFEIPYQRPGNDAALAFQGRWQDSKIVGAVRHGTDQGSFELVPLADFAPDIYEGRT